MLDSYLLKFGRQCISLVVFYKQDNMVRNKWEKSFIGVLNISLRTSDLKLIFGKAAKLWSSYLIFSPL